MKKILLILLILLFAVHAAWGLIRIGGIGTNGGLNIGQGGIGFYKSAETIDYTGTYWGTARTAYWTDTRVALWSTTRITEIPE